MLFKNIKKLNYAMIQNAFVYIIKMWNKGMSWVQDGFIKFDWMLFFNFFCFIYLSCFFKLYIILFWFSAWGCFSSYLLTFEIWTYFVVVTFISIKFSLLDSLLLLEILWILFIVAIICSSYVFQFSFFIFIDDLPLKFNFGISQSSCVYSLF